MLYPDTDFLAFARNLSESILVEDGKRWTPADAASVPLESDELLLEFLCRHNYDIPLAKFKLMCQMAHGKGVVLLLTDVLVYVCESGCVDVLQTQAMQDKYSQLTSLSSSWLAPARHAYGTMKEIPDGLSRRYISCFMESRAELAEVPGNEQAPPSTKNSDRKTPRANTKQVIRKRWESFRKQMDAMLEQVHGSDQKCHVADILRLIFEASQLEPLVENPGENFMSMVNSDLTELQRVSFPTCVALSIIKPLI